MSTRSRIAERIKGTDRYRSIHCQMDGYPEHNGLILMKHFDTDEKASGLIDGGVMSNKETGGVEINRWSCDPNAKPIFEVEDGTLDALMEEFRDSDAEYLYVWEDQTWHCFKCGIMDRRQTEINMEKFMEMTDDPFEIL
jgi:hypothetical protein